MMNLEGGDLEIGFRETTQHITPLSYDPAHFAPRKHMHTTTNTFLDVLDRLLFAEHQLVLGPSYPRIRSDNGEYDPSSLLYPSCT